MLHYKIVFAQQLEELMEDVRENCQDDWIPQGGVSRGPLGQGLISKQFFFQAMIKKTSDDEQPLSDRVL